VVRHRAKGQEYQARGMHRFERPRCVLRGNKQ
jgi:hypothetical protein